MLYTTRTLATVAATSLVVLTGASADAATVNFGATGVNPGGGSGAGTVATASVDGTSFVNFAWNPAPYLAYAEFTSSMPFDLTFSGYTPSETNQVSGFQLYSGSFSNDGATGITPQFTGDTRCGTSLSGTFGAPDCIIVTGSGSSANEVKPSETFGLIEAGTYTLAFLETSQPPSGSAQFEISAIPLPAGVWLLLSGIGGMALLQRRRKTA